MRARALSAVADAVGVGPRGELRTGRHSHAACRSPVDSRPPAGRWPAAGRPGGFPAQRSVGGFRAVWSSVRGFGATCTGWPWLRSPGGVRLRSVSRCSAASGINCCIWGAMWREWVASWWWGAPGRSVWGVFEAGFGVWPHSVLLLPFGLRNKFTSSKSLWQFIYTNSVANILSRK